MHILYLQQQLILPEAPGSLRSWQNASHWVSLGSKVTFITCASSLPENLRSHDPDAPPLRTTRNGITIYTVNAHYDHSLPLTERMKTFARFAYHAYRISTIVPKFDIVLAYSPPLSVAEVGRRIAKRAKVPLHLEIADVWPEVPAAMGLLKFPGLNYTLRRFAQASYTSARSISTFSPDMLRQIHAYKNTATKTFVSFNGTNSDTVFPPPPRRPASSKVTICYAGTAGLANGLETLIHAVAILRTNIADIRCLVIGAGRELNKAIHLAKRLRLTNITFLKSRPWSELGPLLRNEVDIGISTINCFPVLQANAATKFFDYLACGIPVVINHRGWQAEYLCKESCGLASDLGDINAFASNIAYLAGSVKIRREMAEAASVSAKRDFLRTKIATKMLQRFAEPTITFNQHD